MAKLPVADRAALDAALQADLSARREVLGPVLKSDLRAAVDAADDWLDTGAASYNAALPVAARTALTESQKMLLLMLVIRRRYAQGA